MRKENNLLRINLQLFAEGAGSGEGGTGVAEGTGATATVAASQTGRRAANNPLADVKYGIQDETQPTQVASAQEEGATPTIDRNAEFEKLIKGEYKDLYDARMQDTIQKRLKGTKETVEKYEALSPMLEILGKKYGVDPTDTAALSKAIEEDDTYFEDEALEKGIPVEQLKAIRKMERENAELKRQMEQADTKKRANELYSAWLQQADALKAVYPSFDLEAEMRNPKFVDLLRVPSIDVRTAYEVIHKDEILPAAMQFAAKTAEQKVANRVMANASRPTENGNSSQSAALTKSDVSQLTKADRQEIIRRVQRGEKIRF